MTPRRGFGPRAVSFYQGLVADNSREYWAEHREVYEDDVRAPMQALADELEAEFGRAKLYRPNRDVRFSADKSPYKTHQGALAVRRRLGYYVEIGVDGFVVGGGVRGLTPTQLAGLRAGIADGRSGARVARLLDELRAQGFELFGDRLKTAPRGYARDHARIDLLRYKELLVLEPHGEPDWLGDHDAVVACVRRGWRAIESLQPWFDDHVGPADEAEIERRAPKRR